jgi:hypothetical protein
VNRKPLNPIVDCYATTLGASATGGDSRSFTNIKNPLNNNYSGSNNNNVSSSTPHDEAIEFELSISLHGRKYTAKRTLQCIVKLRDDLIREMNHRKQWLTRQQQQQRKTSSSSVLHREWMITANREDNNDYNEGEDDGKFVQIPEIPPLTMTPGDDKDRPAGSLMVGGMGFVGRGFTMLHAMVTSYVPVMEHWLKNIILLVPQDSECLLNFLWEPASSSLNEDFGSILEASNSKTNLSMGSIKELDFEDDT